MRITADRLFAPLAVLPTGAVMLAVFGIPAAVLPLHELPGLEHGAGPVRRRVRRLGTTPTCSTDDRFVGSMPAYRSATPRRRGGGTAVGLGVALLLNIDLPWSGCSAPADRADDDDADRRGALLEAAARSDHGVINLLYPARTSSGSGSPGTALVTVAVVNVWQNAPYVAMLLLAGLRSLPREPIGGGAIDGAGRLQMFRHVILPLLRPYLLVALLLRMIFEFRVLRQRLRHDRRRPCRHHHAAVDLHLSDLVRLVRSRSRGRRRHG